GAGGAGRARDPPAARPGERAGSPVSQRPRHAALPGGGVGHHQADGPPGGDSEACDAPHAAPQLRDAPAREGGGPAGGAGDAVPRGPRHYADLHAPRPGLPAHRAQAIPSPRMSGPGPERQRAIFLDGVRGRAPRVPVSFERLEARARAVMSREGFAYVAGGAGAELTLRANRAAFERWAIVPRLLRDVSVRDLSIELFGDRLPAPILLAPVGVLEMAHREADAAVARAAARAEIPMIVSSQASCPIETCAAVGSGPRWFPLYWNGVDAAMESVVRGAGACHRRAGLLPHLRPGQRRAAVRRFAATFPRPSLSWEDIPRLRELTKLPLLLKGILHPDDARRAVDAGADGVIVSNHGGRQVDGAIA